MLFKNIKNKIGKSSLLYQTAYKMYYLPKILFTRYGYVYNYLIFPITGALRSHHIKPFFDKNIKKIELLKNIHKNKRCFIIATGPSLRVEDIEKLNDEITIGVNSLYKLYDQTLFRPTYYAVLDPDVQKNVEEHVKQFDVFCKKGLFFNPIRKCSKIHANYLPICYQNHWFNVYNPRFKPYKNLRFTKNLVYGIYDKYTITNVAIDMAIYMGCKDIYLLGVDCNYTGPKIHFDDTKESTKEERESGYYTQRAMMAGYKFMEKETKKRGIHIYNATRGGMLEEFDRVDFDSLFN